MSSNSSLSVPVCHALVYRWALFISNEAVQVSISIHVINHFIHVLQTCHFRLLKRARAIYLMRLTIFGGVICTVIAKRD